MKRKELLEARRVLLEMSNDPLLADHLVAALRTALRVVEDRIKGDLHRRVNLAIRDLLDMIDGGDECRARDSEISRVIGLLEGDPNELHARGLYEMES